MRERRFESEIWLPRPREELFAFFSDAANLQELTPGSLHFQIVTPMPIEIRAGTLIDYRLRIRGLPVRWQTRITVWEPPHRFVDVQARGPYRRWIHEHIFEPSGGGTLIRDQVRYAVPFDLISHRWFVRQEIERIFACRSERIFSLFGGSSAN